MKISVNVQENQPNKLNRRTLGQKVKTHLKSALTLPSLVYTCQISNRSKLTKQLM